MAPSWRPPAVLGTKIEAGGASWRILTGSQSDEYKPVRSPMAVCVEPVAGKSRPECLLSLQRDHRDRVVIDVGREATWHPAMVSGAVHRKDRCMHSRCCNGSGDGSAPGSASGASPLASARLISVA